MKEVIEKILSVLAEETKSPRIHITQDEVIVQVDRPDHGRVIGRHGFTFAALSIITWYAGLHQKGKPLKLVVLEPSQENTTPIPIPYMPKAKVNEERLKQFVTDITNGVGISKSEVSFKGDGRVLIKLHANHEDYKKPDFEASLATCTAAAGRVCGGLVTTTIEWHER